MRILISNDDGIHAPGLKVLVDIARQFSDDIWVVAPETDQSGVAHSLTFRRPLRLREVGEQRYAVDGTPTDCVLLALQHVLKDKPVDLVLSGINHGANLAEDITYSGTVAAAMEATLFDIRAVAMSQVADFKNPTRWETAAHWGAKAVEKLLDHQWPSGVLMNVNFPDRAHDEIHGIKVAVQGQRKSVDELTARRDPFGQPYYWIGAIRDGRGPAAGTDLHGTADGWVTITPVKLDLTDHHGIDDLRSLLER